MGVHTAVRAETHPDEQVRRPRSAAYPSGVSDPREGDGSGLELDWGSRRRGGDSTEEAAPAAEQSPAIAPTVPIELGRPPAVWAADEEDAALERRLRRWAVPVALAVAWLLVQTRMGAFLAKIFSGMWLHELGHASVAWLCGFFAAPGPWKTLVGEERSWGVGLTVLALIAYWAYRLWTQHRYGRLWMPAAVLVLQAIGTLGLRNGKAQALITFGGDGGALIFGALLILTFYSRRETQLRQGWLRWGFLVLGALGFMETAGTWWAAVRDVDAIPFGEIEGVGASDPVRLTEWYGWTIPQMVRTYVTTSVLALLTVAAFYVRGWFFRSDEEEEA